MKKISGILFVCADFGGDRRFIKEILTEEQSFGIASIAKAAWSNDDASGKKYRKKLNPTFTASQRVVYILVPVVEPGLRGPDYSF